MTTSRIIYQNESGGVAVIVPTGELPIEAVAQKDAPAGNPSHKLKLQQHL